MSFIELEDNLFQIIWLHVEKVIPDTGLKFYELIYFSLDGKMREIPDLISDFFPISKFFKFREISTGFC